MKIIHIPYIPILEIYHENLGRLSFTSFVSTMDKFIFLSDHLERLLQGYVSIFGRWPANENKVSLMLQIENELMQHFRANHHYRLVMIEDKIFLSQMAHSPKEIELKVTLKKQITKEQVFPSCVKNGDYQHSFELLKQVQKDGFEDVIFFDSLNCITEATTSNVFVVTESQTVMTNPDSPYVLAGVTRKNLNQYFNQGQNGIDIKAITLEDLKDAREIWLVNAVQGLRFVSVIDDKHYQRTGSLFDRVVENAGRFGERINGK